MERRESLNRGAAQFLAESTPTASNLIDHTHTRHFQLTHSTAGKVILPAEALERVQASRDAREAVRREYAAEESKDKYGNIPHDKPDDSIRLIYEHFSSLSLFLVGPMHHKKIQQINKLMSDYEVDILAGCKTQTDWQFVDSEEDKNSNLVGNGRPTRGACGYNINDGKIKQDQWGGTCISAFGWLSSFVTDTSIDSTGLGRWSWLYVGGGGKTTWILIAYQPVRPNNITCGGTVWDQHVHYFEARGEVRNPCIMFQLDLLSLLCVWKATGDEILLLGDFNEDMYTGRLSLALSDGDLRMMEVC